MSPADGLMVAGWKILIYPVTLLHVFSLRTRFLVSVLLLLFHVFGVVKPNPLALAIVRGFDWPFLSQGGEALFVVHMQL